MKQNEKSEKSDFLRFFIWSKNGFNSILIRTIPEQKWRKWKNEKKWKKVSFWEKLWAPLFWISTGAFYILLRNTLFMIFLLGFIIRILDNTDLSVSSLWTAHISTEQATRGVRKLRHFVCKDPTAYGSRPKTHARFLVSEWHLQIWMCVFCCSGERPRKRGVRFAKGLNSIIYK